MMFCAYDQVRELKSQLDTFIKQGKKYYKNYEISCGISFDPKTEYKVEDGTIFNDATCEWKLVSKHKNKLPEKMKALSLWENYHFGPFEDLTHDYVCKAAYSFVCPKVEKEYYKTYKIPMEILKQANPDDFELFINITIGKNKLVEKFSIEEWRIKNYSRKLHLPSIWSIGFLKPWRILSQAKALLRIELDSSDISKQIAKDFSSIYKDPECIFSNPSVSMNLSYDYRRPFGIRTKRDSLVEQEIQIMCGLDGISSGNLDNHSNKTDIPQWCEPFIFMDPPYNKHFMCFANHGIWDHCSLRPDQILNLKPRNFAWSCEVSFGTFGLTTERETVSTDVTSELIKE